MTDYKVRPGGAPFYRYNNGQVKAFQGRLGEGYQLSGSPAGSFVITYDALPGAEVSPPYALKSDTLEQIQPPADGGGGTPPPEPLPAVRFVCPVGKFELIGYDVNGEAVGLFYNTNEFEVGTL